MVLVINQLKIWKTIIIAWHDNEYYKCYHIQKIDNSKTFLWLFHVVNKYQSAGMSILTQHTLNFLVNQVLYRSYQILLALLRSGTIPRSKFMINCNKHKNANKVLRVLISRCSCSIASCRIPFFSNTCCGVFNLFFDHFSPIRLRSYLYLMFVRCHNFIY